MTTSQTTHLHVDDYPATIELLDALLGAKHSTPGGYDRHEHGIALDWEALESSWLSSTEKAVVRIARGLSTIEHNGPGPGHVDDAVLQAVARIYGSGAGR